MPRQHIPGVLVGYENSDDAGVFELTPDVVLVQTVDYFPPIVDDPYTYGQIAAANSLSDVYAMGGVPKTALSIVGFPTAGVDFNILGDIMRGGVDKLNEAGVALLGGHSVRDDEIKFGYAVTGIVEKKDIKQNSAGRAGIQPCGFLCGWSDEQSRLFRQNQSRSGFCPRRHSKYSLRSSNLRRPSHLFPSRGRRQTARHSSRFRNPCC